MRLRRSASKYASVGFDTSDARVLESSVSACFERLRFCVFRASGIDDDCSGSEHSVWCDVAVRDLVKGSRICFIFCHVTLSSLQVG